MSELLKKPIVLSLNRNWERIGFITVEKAVVKMCGGHEGREPAALGLPVEAYEDGAFNIGLPVNWEEWCKLPVREGDLAISTKSGAVRCPLVVIRPNYAKTPLKAPKLSKKAILERDGHRCQYSGEVLPASQLNVDHVIPKDRGGRDSWDNLVASRKDINTKKGNKLNSEAGLVLKRKPVAPKPIPVSFTIKKPLVKEHEPFFNK